MSKICNNCGREVDDRTNFCPNCKSQSFRNKNELAAKNNNMVHKLFYWDYDGYYVLSKAKLTSIAVFLMFSVVAILSGAPGVMVLLAFIFALLIFAIGFGIHKIRGNLPEVKVINNDYGIITDMIHLLFFWQDSEGDYVLSKTKIISHLVFVLFFAISLTGPLVTLFGAIMVGLLFEIPAFLIGFAIHKLSGPKKKPQKQVSQPKPLPKTENSTPQKQVIPEYVPYLNRLDDLNSRFIKKDRAVRELIEKRFEPPQITYTRFISGVDRSKKLFGKNLESAMTMINIADNYSERIAAEVESKIAVLEAIIDKLDSLSNELIVNEDLSKKEDVDDLIGEMDDLIDSVREYNE